MNHTLIKPLYEEGDLVYFNGYKPRKFSYTIHRKKWDSILGDLACPHVTDTSIFIVIDCISAKELFRKSSHEHLSSEDNGYIVVSQSDGVRYFVYENELRFV
jgi:hypothetical protein